MDIDQLDRILIARSSSFGGEAHKLLWYLTLRLEFDRFSIVNIAETAWDLGLKPQAPFLPLRPRGGRATRRHIAFGGRLSRSGTSLAGWFRPLRVRP
jgi:hypothetical protein